VAAIVKMATGRNFSMSGINSGHHNLPTYEMALKSDNVEFVRYCGSHFENGRHFQNGHHNTAHIQHCPISTTFYMWVDYDVPK
jgi:5-carboxymethyl-2-hydroxymuconate isomerase